MLKTFFKSTLLSLLLSMVFSILLAGLPCRTSLALEVGCTNPVALTPGVPYSGTTCGGSLIFYFYGCTEWGEAGPEIVHSITTSFIQADITATLSNLNGVDLDVFILKENQCESTGCVAGNYSATYTQAPPGTHYIVVDGYGLDEFGACGSYTLTVTAECSHPIPLTLGVPYSGETNGGPPSNVSSYSCARRRNEGGPEVIHRVITSSGVIRAELSNLEADLDVFILRSCDASSCLAYGDNMAEYRGESSGEYYIVVDGYGGAAGAYTLIVTGDPCSGVNCDDRNPCTADWCDPEAGCVHEPLVCDDDNFCTEDWCDPGMGCVNEPVGCDDGNLCTEDWCDPATGECRFFPISCGDRNLCTEDWCEPGVGCVNEPVACNDRNLCTEDSCDPATGCVNTPIGCEDDNPCTIDSCNPEEGCIYRPVSCDDDNTCTEDWCEPGMGCINEPVGCDDDNACTEDWCNPEVGCINEPVACNDRNLCTADECDPATGCIYAPIGCDDGNLCTEDWCEPGTGCMNTLIDCEDGNPCTVDSCHPATGECRHAFICQPPRIISFPGKQAAVGEEYSYDVEAEDPDGQTLIYLLEASPSGMTIDPESGFIRWRPASSDAGDQAVTIRVEDQTGQSDVQTYILSVIEAEFIFRGYVYQGTPPDIGRPVSGVTVELYGDADEQPDNGSERLLAGSVTDSSGGFSLAWVRSGDCPFLHVIKSNPSGLYSTGAQADEPGFVKTITVVSFLNNADLLPCAYSGLIFWVEQLPFSPAGFGSSIDYINFDDLSGMVPVTSQFTMQGVLLQSADGSPLQVMTAEQMAGGRPQSPPLAVSTAENGLPLEMRFLLPRTRVGFTFFLDPVEAGATARLRAYDAHDQIIEESSIQFVPKPLRDRNTFFIGIAAEGAVIHRVTFDYRGLQAVKVIDDLRLEPSHESSVAVASWQGLLISPEAIQEEKLAAIDALQLQPSQQTSDILQGVAREDPDLYVRERAIMALAQVRDPGAIPTLTEIGLDPPTGEIRMAASNAVWALRRLFPLPGWPEVTIEAISPIQAGEEFEVEARITSPVDRAHVQITLGSGKNLVQRRRDDFPDGYKGPLTAWEPVILRAGFLASRVGRTRSVLTIRINLNRIDRMTYRIPLYIDIQEDGGSASMNPFSGLNETDEHLVPIDYE